MAEENEAKEAGATEGGEAKEGAETPEGSTGKGSLFSSPIVKIVLFVVMLAVMGGGSFMVVQKIIRPKVAPEEVTTEETLPSVPEPGELFVIEDLVINPAGTRASRFLRVAAALEYPVTEKELGAELEQRRFQLRDLLITEFSSRTLDELVDAQVKEEIREELLSRLNRNVNTGKLTNLYFTEYVIQ
jgi:flagellar FliL protein